MEQIRLAASPISDPEIEAAVRVLRGGQLAQGPEVAAFEAEFAALMGGTTEAAAVSSGTSALHLCLLGLGIGRGAEVIVPSFTFGATAHAVVAAGAVPVFADIDPSTLCIDPSHAASLITERTSAIIAVHLFGRPADMTALRELATRCGLALVEDAAQAVGAALGGRSAGTLGDAAAFSFYPTKNVCAIEGGMVTTADPMLADKVRVLRNQGMRARYQYEVPGFNARMTDVSAAVGRVQLAALRGKTVARQQNAAWLSTHLRGVLVPGQASDVEQVFHQYVIRSDHRDRLAARLAAAGIDTAIHYPVPVHRSDAYGSAAELPHSDAAAGQVLSLPVHPQLSTLDLERIAEVVNRS